MCNWDNLKDSLAVKDFCIVCGHPATKLIGNNPYCNKHNAPKEVIKRDKELHGKSNSVNRWYDYQ